MQRSRVHRAAGVYLSLFFLSVAAAPHHHYNGLEDLLLDQRSDSGILIDAAEASGSAPAISPFRLHADVPCLACFSGDFVWAPAPTVAFSAALFPLSLRPEPSTLEFPESPFTESSSRAPPRIS